MPAPKALTEHVREATFRSRRHHALLAGSVVPWRQLAIIQANYAAATSEPERRALGVAFERAVRELQEAGGTSADDDLLRRLDEILTSPPVPYDPERWHTQKGTSQSSS